MTDLTPARLAALYAIEHGGSVNKSDLVWLQHGGFVDERKKLTARGAKVLAEHDREIDDAMGSE